MTVINLCFFVGVLRAYGTSGNATLVYTCDCLFELMLYFLVDIFSLIVYTHVIVFFQEFEVFVELYEETGYQY